MSKLLICFKPYPEESLISLCYRLAKANFYKNPAQIFTNDTIKNLYLIHRDFDSQFIKEICYLTGFSYSYLRDHTLTRLISNEESYRVPFFSNQKQKFCPTCLKENLYHRYNWDLVPFNICVKHQNYLIAKCDKCNKYITLKAIVNGYCDCGQNLLEMRAIEANNEKELKMQRLIYNKIKNHNNNFERNNPIFNLPPNEFFPTITRFAEILYRYPTSSFNFIGNTYVLNGKGNFRNNLAPQFISKLFNEVIYLLSNWPQNFDKYLKEYKQTYYKRKKPRCVELTRFLNNIFFKINYIKPLIRTKELLIDIGYGKKVKVRKRKQKQYKKKTKFYYLRE